MGTGSSQVVEQLDETRSPYKFGHTLWCYLSPTQNIQSTSPKARAELEFLFVDRSLNTRRCFYNQAQ
jgi:hypothetical protein